MWGKKGTGRIGDRYRRTYWRQDILATDAEADLLATVPLDILATVLGVGMGGMQSHMGKGGLQPCIP